MTNISYADFGVAFVQQAVTPERIQGVLRSLTGDVIEVGPIRAGPGGAAQAYATGRVGPATIQRTGTEPLSFRVTLQVEVRVRAEVAGTQHHIEAQLLVTLSLGIRTAEPLLIVVTPAAVRPDDIAVTVVAKGLRARAIAVLGDVSGELKRHVAEYVNDRIAGPDAQQATTIDLLPIMNSAWPSPPAHN